MQTTNSAAERRRGLPLLVKIPLALDFLAADAMRLIPVHLRFAYLSTAQSDERNSLELAPTARAIQPAEPRQVPDALARSDRPALRAFAYDLQGHSPPL